MNSEPATGDEVRREAYDGMLDRFGLSYAGVGYSRQGCLRQYQVARETLGIRSGDRVLDVGCGLGFGVSILSDTRYLGLDVNPRMIAGAVELHRNTRLFRAGTLADLSGERFDWTLCLGIFNLGYAWAEVERVLRFVWGLTTRGLAVVFLTTPHVREPVHTIFPVPQWLSLGPWAGRFVLRTDWSANQALLTIFAPEERR